MLIYQRVGLTVELRTSKPQQKSGKTCHRASPYFNSGTISDVSGFPAMAPKDESWLNPCLVQ